MKKKMIIAALGALLLFCLFVAFAAIRKPQQPQTVYEDNCISVERTKTALFITDNKTGSEYQYRLKRTRKAAESAMTTKESVSTNTLTIGTVYNIVIVTEQETGKTLYFKVR